MFVLYTRVVRCLDLSLSLSLSLSLLSFSLSLSLYLSISLSISLSLLSISLSISLSCALLHSYILCMYICAFFRFTLLSELICFLVYIYD